MAGFICGIGSDENRHRQHHGIVVNRIRDYEHASQLGSAFKKNSENNNRKGEAYACFHQRHTFCR